MKDLLVLLDRLKLVLISVAQPRFMSLLWGFAGLGFACAPWAILGGVLFVERKITPNCGGNCFSTAVGWILIISLLFTVPFGALVFLSGIKGFLLRLFAGIKSS